MKTIHVLLMALLVCIGDAAARGPASTTGGGGGGDGGFLLLMVLLAVVYLFFISNFGMSLLLLAMLTGAMAVPLVMTWVMFRHSGGVVALSYGAIFISLYWGPLFRAVLPSDKKYESIINFGEASAFLTFFALIPIFILIRALDLLFESDQLSALGALAVLIGIHYWAFFRLVTDSKKSD
jgi:hypothetical protein